MNETRHQIVELADELIRQKGFNAFSYSDISMPLAIRNSAIHYYFASKSELGAAVIDAELERVRGYRGENSGLSGEEQLKTLVKVFYRNSELHNICLIGSLTPDYNTFAAPMQDKVREMCVAILDWLTDALSQAREAGQLRFEGASEARALLVISGLLSSLLLSRVLGGHVFERMLDQLLQDMEVSWRIADLKIDI